jgi:hypothetical protein
MESPNSIKLARKILQEGVKAVPRANYRKVPRKTAAHSSCKGIACNPIGSEYFPTKGPWNGLHYGLQQGGLPGGTGNGVGKL